MKSSRNRLVLTSFAIAAALAAAGCEQQSDRVADSRAQGKGTAGVQDTPAPQASLGSETLKLGAKSSEQLDRTLQEKVVRALRSAPGIHGDAISVATEEGRVHLGGVVRSADERVKIERIASQVPGVTTVSSSIAVEGETPRS